MLWSKLVVDLMDTNCNKNQLSAVGSHPHPAPQNQTESCHLMYPDLKVRRASFMKHKWKTTFHLKKKAKSDVKIKISAEGSLSKLS